MKTENHPISDVLSKNATSFYIPPFQRAYAWGKPEIERYFSDIVRIIESELDSKQHDKLEHFFGTLVIKDEKEGFVNKSVVVDGQQRLTTTLLFLIALRDLETDETTQLFINESFLKNNTSAFQDKIKLKQVTKDWESYRALVNKEEPKQGIIYNAYLLFVKEIRDMQLKNPQIQTKHYVGAIQKMNVAVIFLDNRPFKGEDPQIIFETLNSLGKPLTLSDLIRNFVLLNMDSTDQSKIYEETWHPKIEAVLNENTSYFFRDYLQYKKQTSIKAIRDDNTKEIYQIFKDFVKTEFTIHNDFIKDIIRYVTWYKWIITEVVYDRIALDTNKNIEIKELIRNIFHDIKAEAFKPFVLGLLEYHQCEVNKVRLSDDLLISILKTIRTFLIRRRVLGLSQGENKNIVLLCDRIEELSLCQVSMVDLLSNMFYRMRLPNDAEIKKGFIAINFYDCLKKYSKFILGKIEENNTKVSVDFRNPKITIEHIMPQKLNSDWETELGPNFAIVHKNFLHNIGNLILTEFNSEMGNKTFKEKKIRLNSSSLNYRLSVTNRDIWNEKNIIEHQEQMINWFLETFPLPDSHKTASNWNTTTIESTSFSPMDIDADNLAEGNKPLEIRISGNVIKVTTWQDVFIRFIEYIKNDPNFDFDYILENQDMIFYKNHIIVKWINLKPQFDENSELITRYKTFKGKFWDKISNHNDEELFVHTNISASNCVNRIANVMNRLNIPDNNVEILLKDETKRSEIFYLSAL